MSEVSTAPVRRSLDRSRRRKPLRLLISRRRAPSLGFVTQVRFGGREAVVVPWQDGRPGLGPHPVT